jgi:hypothetical protein
MAAENPEKAADKLLNVISGRVGGDFDRTIVGAIQSILISAEAIEKLWDHTGTNMISGYPKCLPSWDEFVVQLRDWYLKQREERIENVNR